MPSPLTPLTLSPHLSIPPQAIDFPSIRIVFFLAFRIRIHPDPLHLAGSGSTLILASDPDPDPDPLRFLFRIRVAPKLFRVISKTKCFCYLRNSFSKFWRQ